jgi:hypothetical protein
LRQPGTNGKIAGLAPTELQGDWMLEWIKAEMPLDIAMDERAGRDHFRIEKGLGTDRAMEDAAMPVRPVHHRRDAKCVVADAQDDLI